MTSISVPAFVAEYGFVGSSKLACSVFEAFNSYELSPYTSSVETCKNLLMVPSVLHDSNKTCVPKMLFSVNAKEFPNELSTCVCAAKCMMVSIFSFRKMYETKSAD